MAGTDAELHANAPLERPARPVLEAPAPPAYAGRVLAVAGLALIGALAGWASFEFPWKVVLGIVLGIYVTAQTAVKPIAGLVFLIIALPFVDLFPPSIAGLPALNALNLILLVVGAFGIANAVVRRHRLFPPNPVTRPLLIYAMIMGLSALVVLQHPPSWGLDIVMNDLKASITSFLPFFFAGMIVRSEKERRVVLYTVIVMVILVAARALVDYGIDLAQGGSPERLRIGGLIGQANDFGGYLAIAIPMILVMAMGERRVFWRPFLLAGGALTVMALLFTQSRGGIVACGFALATLGVLRERKLLFAFLLALALTPLWVPSVVTSRFQETRRMTDTGEEQFDRSSQVRLDVWQGGLHLFASSPIFGHGWASFTSALNESRFEGEVRAPHSTYVRTLAEMGIIGMAGLTWLLATLLRLGASRRVPLSPFDTRLANGLFGAVLALAVVNVFGTRFYNIEEMGYFWILAGLVATCAWNARPAASPEPA